MREHRPLKFLKLIKDPQGCFFFTLEGDVTRTLLWSLLKLQGLDDEGIGLFRATHMGRAQMPTAGQQASRNQAKMPFVGALHHKVMPEMRRMPKFTLTLL